MSNEKKALPTEQKAPLKNLVILCFFWGILFITALTLIINLFQTQWQQMLNTVGAYVQNNPQATVASSSTEESTNTLTVIDEEIAAEPEASASGKQNLTFDAAFIEGLLEAISSSSASAQIASASAALP
ncbi:MAG: hypothetical protein Q4G02_00155 [bacterium]|nr:hypothetical protein [bacterium]